MKNNIRKDYLWNTLGVFAQNAISPLLLIIITRINGISSAGIFSFAFSVAITFMALGMWGGRTYQVSDVKHEFSQRSYIMVRLFLSLIVLIGAIAFTTLNNYDPVKSAIILGLVLYKVLESIADAIYGVLQVHGRLYVAGRSLFYKAILSFVAFVVIDISTHNILLSSLSIVFVNVLYIILYDIKHAKKLEDIKITRSAVSKYIQSAFVIMKRTSPIFAVSFLSIFCLNIPRYFIDLYHSEDNGYFGILAMPLTLIVLLVSFMLQPNVVGMSKQYEEKNYKGFNETVVRLLGITLLIGAVALIAAITIAIPVLGFIFGVDFSDYKLDLVIMLVGGIASALVAVYVNILTIMRHFKTQFYVLLASNILLIIFSAGIIKYYGLMGGVSVFAVASTIQIGILITAYRTILRRAAYDKKN